MGNDKVTKGDSEKSKYDENNKESEVVDIYFIEWIYQSTIRTVAGW